MNKTLIQTAFALAFGTVAIGAHATTLVNGNVLTVTSGIQLYDGQGNPAGVSSGSWAAVDSDGNSNLSPSELWAVPQGTTGIVIGVATSPGDIDAPYNFFGSPAVDFTSIGITGSTTSGLDMSGWKWTWNGNTINMGSGAWGAGYSNGIGNFVWDGVYGHAYTLDYRATVPAGDPSGTGGYQFAWHFEGVVAVPEASTYAMMLAGLGLVGAAVRRRKQA